MSDWKTILRQNITDWKELLAELQLDPAQAGHVLRFSSFPLNIPKRLVEKIEKGRFDDPILLQFLPTAAETPPVEGFSFDAVGDIPSRKERKLLHKYENRALLLTTGACAMNCRFCFRRHFDYETKEKGFEEELHQFRKDATLSEVILSGGDPLSLSNERLQLLIEQLDKIPHLKRLRFHTRFPIGIPERIDDSFIALLKGTRLQVIFIIHCNHAKELDRTVCDRLKKIQQLGIPILCQTVLLKGVNDSIDTLKDLFEMLVDHGILPYYLHQLDKVAGAMHFEVSREKGIELINTLKSLLPGYAIPQYVEEIARPTKQDSYHMRSIVLSPTSSKTIF